MTTLLSHIEQRWRAQFDALVAGADVAPGHRLRLEGLVEAAVLIGEVDTEQLTQRMDTVYKASFGRSIAEDFGDDWRVLFPFPQVPAMAARAPVVPTTKD